MKSKMFHRWEEIERMKAAPPETFATGKFSVSRIPKDYREDVAKLKKEFHAKATTSRKTNAAQPTKARNETFAPTQTTTAPIHLDSPEGQQQQGDHSLSWNMLGASRCQKCANCRRDYCKKCEACLNKKRHCMRRVSSDFDKGRIICRPYLHAVLTPSLPYFVGVLRCLGPSKGQAFSALFTGGMDLLF